MARQLSQASEVLTTPKSVQVWKAVVNWLTFFFQIFIHFAHLFCYVGLRHPLLSSSSSSPPPSSSSYKPLPVVELAFRESPSSENTTTDVQIDKDVSHGVDGVADRPLKRLTVVLDLDETLVCSYETSTLPDHVRSQATEAGLKWFDLECVSVDKESDGKPKVNHVTVFERPGLHEFLKQIGEFADLVLFTAGLEGYARPLVDRIDVENRFSLRLYRPSTVSTEHREHVKDLSCLSEDLCRIVIVDNNPFSFLLQPLNGVPCVPFSAGNPFDEQLLDVLLPLLKHLSLQKDVRPVLYERFHMPEWFQMQGIPATEVTMDWAGYKEGEEKP
ncbi:FCP1 homology domain [Dillenia turbinata]|uniref:FCP1 homology domain n=1 Tax=Dillenia turbinata TaxID=194707 RepID=A0AAN8ZMP5_9MAGN